MSGVAKNAAFGKVYSRAQREMSGAAANETRGGEMPGRIRDGRSEAGFGGEAEHAKP